MPKTIHTCLSKFVIMVTFYLCCNFGKVSCKQKANVKPINNNPIKIKPSADNNPNYYQNQDEEEILQSYYQTYDGYIGDTFIPFRDSSEFVSTLPSKRQQTVTKKEIEITKRKQLENKNHELNEYFFMRKRILAPTTKP